MTIRKATTNDIEALKMLYWELLPDEAVDVNPEVIKKIDSLPEYSLLVYEEDGKVLGTTMLIVCYDAVFRNSNFAVIENVVVSSEARGKGIGRKLMDEAEFIARDNKCIYVLLLSNKKRLNAHKFYRNLGYSDELSLGFKKYL